VSYEKRIIIELDGGQHANQKKKDQMRDKRLKEDGFKILRFWNNDVLEDIDAILEIIKRNCL
jgi:very-short-patch-repair endonuclease